MAKDITRDKFFAEMEKELKRFVDTRTGLLDNKYSVYIDCPLCRKNNFKKLFDKSGFTYVRCSECTFVFVNPRLNEDSILEGYSESNHAESNRIWKEVLETNQQQSFNTQAYSFLLKELKKLGKVSGKLLDVGCSIGHFMSLAKQFGFEAEGVELEPQARAAAIKKGFIVKDHLIENSSYEDKSFDVVSLLGLIEHLPNPLDFMQHIRRILKDDGFILFNGVPNINSINNIMLGSKARVFNGRNHLGYYTKRTFLKLMSDSGFEVVFFDTYVTALDSIINTIQGLDPFDDVSYDLLDVKIKSLLKENRSIVEKFILDNELGYKIRAIVQKSSIPKC